MIQGISSNIQTTVTKTYEKSSKNEDKLKRNEEDKNTTLGKDTFERSEKKEDLTYSNVVVKRKTSESKNSKSDEVKRLIEEDKQRQEDFKKFIRSLLVDQGEKYNLVLFNKKLNVSEENADKAAKSIAEGGEYSVDAVAGRILNMAKSLANGDSSKIDELKEGFLKGFKEAEKVWGGELPDISKKTYDEVLKRFDEWKNESKSEE